MTTQKRKPYEELLSTYTIAANCTDLTDVLGGISDMQEAIKKLENQNTQIPAYYLTRLAKLEEKKQKFQKPIYVVGIGKDMWFNQFQYTTTEADAIKLGVQYNEEYCHKGITLINEPVLITHNENKKIKTFTYTLNSEWDLSRKQYYIHIKELTLYNP